MASNPSSDNKQAEDERVGLKKLGDTNNEEEYEYVTTPPDGGFGWVVAIAAMLCNLVCDGTLFAFGNMKPHLQKHFECSDMVILMVGSVPCGVYLLVGPIVSGLANRYGCRPIIIIGSIGAAACMAASTLSPNVWVMIIVYGIFGGIFFGMVYLPSVVMVSFYFDKKRSIANGMVTAGTGIGALSFGPLADILMKELGWKKGMLIFAVLMLTCVLFGAIMRPLKPKKIPIKRDPEIHYPVLTQTPGSQKKTSPSDVSKPTPDTKLPLLTAGSPSSPANKPATVPLDDKAVSDIPTVATIGGLSPNLQGSRGRTLSATSRTSSVASNTAHPHGVANPEDASRPLYKKDALFTGSKTQIHRLSHTSLNKSNPYMASATNIPALTDPEKKKESTFRAFVNILSAMTDFSILKNKQMLLICIGNVFSMLGYYLPIMLLNSFALDLKVPEKHSRYLLTVFGAFNTFGRFAGGPIAMLPHLNPLRVHNALLFTAGLLTVIAAYVYNFWTCAIYAALCGFAIAPHMSLLPSVICECVGLDRYTTAFGVLFLFRGFTSIVGPPAAGFIKDSTDSYAVAFAIGGAMIIIAAFFHFGVAFVKSDLEETKDESSSDEENNIDEIKRKNKLDI